MDIITLNTKARFDVVDITPQVELCINKSNIKSGIAVIFVPHTTAGITINENADPDVIYDLKNIFNDMIPENNKYKHIEGNSQAHALSILTSHSLTVIIEDSKIILGTWQNIYFMEYDGPRKREVYIQIIKK